MKKKYLLLLLFSVSLFALNAAQRTENEALDLVQQFAKSGVVKIKGQSASQVMAPTLAYVAKCSDAEAAYYVFNYGSDNGYILVSGEDRSLPILGYSDEGSFDYANMPDNMKWWLGEYVKQIEYLKAHPELTAAPQKVASTSKSVAPLLKNTKWNQDSPYNLLCPTYIYNGYTRTSVTGCVATALAQIMYYHKWPERGAGYNSYTFMLNGDETQNKTLSVTFSDSEYDWANMIPEYSGASSTESKNAVSKLMYDCGVSVDMGYGAVSGAITSNVICALTNYFGYDKSVDFLARNVYSCAQWDEMLRAEMDAQRPVLYAGRNESVGHAFVIDGYDTRGYYHVNWGWGGMSNGYFLFSDLTPRSQGTGGSNAGYNEDQGMIVGIKKDAGGTASPHMFLEEPITTTSTEVPLGSSLYYTMNKFQIVTAVKEGLNPYIGYALYDESGKIVKSFAAKRGLLKNGFIYSLPSNSAYIPSSTPEGKYKLMLVYSFVSSNASDLVPIPAPLNQNQYLAVEIKNSKMYISTPNDDSYSLKDSDIAVTSGKVYSKKEFKATAKVTNEGTDSYQDYVYLALVGNGTVKCTSSVIPVAIEPGETVDIESVLNADLSAGNYTLKVLDAGQNVVAGEGLGVEVLATPVAADLQIEKQLDATYTNVEVVEAKVTLKNNGGYYAGNLEMFLLPETGNTILQIIYSGFETLEANETKDFDFSFTIPGAKAGETYRIVLQDPSNTDSYIMWGNTVSFTLDEATGIDEVSSAADVQIYPNPAKDMVSIASPSEISRISVYTMLGACVRDVKAKGGRDAQIDVSSLSAGQYIVSVENTEGTISKVLIKK